MSLKTDILKHITEAISPLNFPSIVWDPNTGIPSESGTVQAQSILVNEVEGSFEKSFDTRGELDFDKVNWIFQVYVKFQLEVDLIALENELCSKVNLLNSPSMTGPVSITPISFKVEHPPRQDATTGTSAIYLFRIDQLHQRKV